MSDSSTAILTCPKCRGAMRAYERNGVTIDQCEECRGIFLDRGELERLIDVEERQLSEPSRGPDDRSSRRDHDDDDDHRSSRSGGKRRRGGFFSELFDD